MGSMAVGPFVDGKLNTQLTPLFHRLVFAPAAVLGPEVTFFGQVAGVGGIGPELTNMTRAFELEAPREFVVNAMRADLYDTTAADAWKLIKNYTLQLIVGGNTLLNAPLNYWTGGTGMVGTPSNGVADPRATQEILPHPIRIPAGVGFSARLIGTSQTVTAATVIGVFLDGPFSKPVS